MIYCFEDYELDLDQLQLRRADEPIPIQPQVFDVLRHLIEHRHRVVPKEELLDTVWGDRFVSESALSSRIKSVRRALGDDGDRQALVRTVHGRGFQFVAVVSELQQPTERGDRPTRTLVVPASRFVGRESDRAGVIELLGERRIVTIWGTGGVGKTRLALHVAADLADDYPDGVHVVELGTIDPGHDVARRVNADLGISERDGRDSVDRLVEAFAGHRTLIVLDNCEHVVDAAGEVAARLLTGTTSIDVLATSRRPLGIDSEQLWSLAPLGLRTPEGSDIAPAVELFLDRVRAVSPGLDLADSSDIIESICQRLDGIPLLLELAAARVRHVGLQGVLDATSDPSFLDRLDDTPSRHGSIDAVIRWSYDLLTDRQRQVFGTLAVFPGWFDLDGASAVAGVDTRTTLWQLTDQSLVTTDLSGRRPLYRVLDPLREFARRQASTDETSRAVRRHARFVVETVTECDRRLRGPHGVEAMKRLVQLDADVVTAHGELLAAGDVDGLDALAKGLFIMANERMRGDVHRLVEEAIDRHAALADRPLPLACAAVGAWQRGDLSAAELLVRRAIDNGIDGDDPVDRSIVHLVHGQVLQLLGEHTNAVAAGLRTIELCDGSHSIVAAKAYAICALATSRSGDAETGLHFASRMADVANASASPLALAWSAYVAGELAIEHRPEEALASFDAAVTLARDAGSALVSGAAMLSSLTLRCRSLDRLTPPMSEFATLLRHWQRAGNWAHQRVTLRNLVVVLAASGRPEPAAVLYGALTSAGSEGSAYGAEAERLRSAMSAATEQLGPDRCGELIATGTRLAPLDAVEVALRAVRAAN